jgi:hypothetical protein
MLESYSTLIDLHALKIRPLSCVEIRDGEYARVQYCGLIVEDNMQKLESLQMLLHLGF